MLRIILVFFTLLLSTIIQANCPNGFVYLNSIDLTILQDMRYGGFHNFIGRPIKGYSHPTCILTKETALALKRVQEECRKKHLTLKVYDCYRPTVAVQDFVAWSKLPDEKMKTEFYPRVSKHKLFQEGYIAEFSGHSRGSTVDVTLVDRNHLTEAKFEVTKPLLHCYAPQGKRFADNSIDMGSGYDCLDSIAHADNKTINSKAFANRRLLRKLMIEQNFIPYEKEWWHFTLKKEPFPKQYFNFFVE